MAHQNYDDSEGVWRTVGGRRIFIKYGQSLTDAMRTSGKFKVTDEGDVVEDFIYTEQLLMNAKPKDGDIEIADYVVDSEGNTYKTNEEGYTFEDPSEEDKEIARWFKHTIWGNVKLQKSIKLPQFIKTADLLILENCPLFKTQTIEFKTVKTTERTDTVEKRIKEGARQSPNVLLDITIRRLDKSVILEQAKKTFARKEGMETLIVKDGNELVLALKR